MKSKKISKPKKVFNYIVCNIIFYLFLSFVVLVTYNKLDIRLLEDIYKNDTVLATVQISNLLLLVWVIVTVFYKLYLFFKKRYDKKIEN